MTMENTMASKVAAPAPETPAVHAQAIPLSLVQSAETTHVLRIRGKDNTQRFLRNLGFVEGAEVTVISELNGSVIVNVKGTRVAISKAMANRVLTN
jgi:ferrous iron transport protein A